MKKLFRLPSRSARRIAAETDDELRFHIEERTARLVANGLAPEEADARARREFGDIEEARSYINAIDRQGESQRRRKDFMGDLAHDVVYGIRKLRSAPVFAVTAILTLAIGLGANTAVLNLINAALLEPPGILRPDEVAWVSPREPNGQYGAWTMPDFVHFRSTSRSWAHLSAIGNIDLTLAGDPSMRLSGQAVNASYFDLVGVRPALGRPFLAHEDSVGTPALTVVLSHALWQTRFHGDSGLVGRTISLNTFPVTVVGIAPRTYTGLRLGEEADFWVPFAALAQLDRRFQGMYNEEKSRWLRAVGRIAPTASKASAQAEARVIDPRLETWLSKERRRQVVIDPVRGRLEPGGRDQVAPILALVMVVPLLVLAVAGANVANLFVSRSVQRQKEIAVRRALGASRGRLVRQLLTECGILGLLAGALGLVISMGLTSALSMTGQLPGDIVPLLVPDPRVFLLTFGLALAAGIVFGLLPALAATRHSITPALKNDGMAVAIGRGRHRLRNIFVVSQVALSLSLLITAGLFLGSLRKALNVEPGYDTHNAIAAGYDLGGQGYDAERVERFGRELLARVMASPGVESAALAQILPLSGSSMTTGVSRAESSLDVRDASSMWSAVSPEFFAAMRIPVVKGRTFADTDNASSTRVAVINEQLAILLWPNADPIGKHLRAGGNPQTYEVIGVVRNGRYRRLAEQVQEGYYWTSSMQERLGTQVQLVVRGTNGTADAISAARNAYQSIDPNLPPQRIETLDAAIARTVEGQRAGAALLGVFGALGLGLAAFGIFGVVAHGVAARTREIGIRMSLGATAAEVVKAFVREGIGLTMIGGLIGITISLAASKVLASLIFGLTATDLVTFAGATGILLTIAAVASFIPARRAAKVDPLTALRSD
jgi:predicted permease